MSFATIVTPSGIIIPDIVDRRTSRKFISWGVDNKLPYYLWDNYLKCSEFQSISNTVYDYIVGEGIKHNYLFDEIDDETFEDKMKRCIFDYIIFGGFALEGLRNYKGEIVRLNYIDVRNVRVNEDLTTAYLSNQWGEWSGKNIIELPIYNKTTKQNHFIFYYRGSITRNINPIPIYASCLKSIGILNNTRNFHLKNLENGFTSAVIINLNNSNIKKRELDEIREKLEKGFCGSENAGKFILMNSGDKEHATTVERLDADNFGDLYQALSESSINDIQKAFRINPMLLGENVQTGFSKEEFENAYKLYDRTVILPLQQNVMKAMKQLDIEVEFIPFKINWA